MPKSLSSAGQLGVVRCSEPTTGHEAGASGATSRSSPHQAAFDRLFVLQGRQEFELAPVLAALELLVDSQRVLGALHDGIEDDSQIKALCPSWRSPQRLDDQSALNVIHGLAVVALQMAEDISGNTARALQSMREAA